MSSNHRAINFWNSISFHVKIFKHYFAGFYGRMILWYGFLYKSKVELKKLTRGVPITMFKYLWNIDFLVVGWSTEFKLVSSIAKCLQTSLTFLELVQKQRVDPKLVQRLCVVQKIMILHLYKWIKYWICLHLWGQWAIKVSKLIRERPLSKSSNKECKNS